MRTTIACERCRRSKVKCRHNGQPPCAGCIKSGYTETCVLSGPVLGQSLGSKRPAKRQRLSVDQSQTDIFGDVWQDINQAFEQTSRAQVISAINLFRAQFPEFGFLHPDDLEYCEDELSIVQKLRLLVIVAVSHRYADSRTADINNKNILFIANEVQKKVTSGPSLALVQTLLILSLCNWGDGDGFNAWMHCGIATRMAQGLLSTGFASCGKRETLSELEKRTLWTCFKMDRLLSCGKRRQAMFPDGDMHFSLPVNDTQFLFGQSPQTAPVDDSLRSYGPDDHLVLLIQGLRIWSRVHTWIAEGGRRQPGMTEPEQCPFNETSDWSKMRQALIKWRESQDALMKYPATKVSVHAQRGQAERFGYINLVYYVSLLFLCREFIPFSPVDEVKPRGPIEPPLLKARGPDSFWLQNVTDLYDAASQISSLLCDLEHVGCPLRTPFSGLCAFSSTLWSIYGAAFPNFMGFTPSQTSDADAQAERTVAVLVRIGKVWRLAEEWIDVLNTAKSIMTRVSEGRRVKRSRYDYPELEDSIHLAPLQGMPRQTFDRPAGLVSADDGPKLHQLVAGDAEQGVETDGLGFLEETSGSEFVGEDWWRLLSFCDDPHLLSTSMDNMGDENVA
ncbi:hypothetical protein NOF04DRAFT_6262 [Fusarium oxysporum II5]|uniref:Zn(2)-C6 fungal-type domain-containing protein n=1 Tax=Fusarium odoratissimum (strain NRRL 54006) TaxID=1089451 RepID=X0JQU8_FUSO5|nr:uncharacterized protein FOIG_09439 [Fusarium odoratissimum NRRL 54006]EXL98710.1 hypothetical protein FOIG_09439 [Fusarium odoratissimum NRRL 54006]KAK2129248.1 hypothetical protein NOF04DRAFT_6262 [Fusarium oxysporum II5]